MYFVSSEAWIDMLAVVSFLVTTVGSIVVARMTDYLKGHMKITIATLIAGAGLVYTILSLVCIGVRDFCQYHHQSRNLSGHCSSIILEP